MSAFKDHFSGHASTYAAFRPSYPESLFATIARQAPGTATAWDCGCGNGQASQGLAAHFGHVFATDASEAQVKAATPHPRITYRTAPAEQSGLPASSVDAVLVAQALHWFDFERFYDEVERVCRPGGLFVASAYGLAQITPEIDAAVYAFYEGDIGPYWPADRAHIDAGYQTIPRRFPVVDFPPIAMTAQWSLDQWVGYLGTWSAVQRYKAATGNDPIPAIQSKLATLWGNPADLKTISWPLTMITGRLP